MCKARMCWLDDRLQRLHLSESLNIWFISIRGWAFSQEKILQEWTNLGVSSAHFKYSDTCLVFVLASILKKMVQFFSWTVSKPPILWICYWKPLCPHRAKTPTSQTTTFTIVSGLHPCWWRVCYQWGLPCLVFTSW